MYSIRLNVLLFSSSFQGKFKNRCYTTQAPLNSLCDYMLFRFDLKINRLIFTIILQLVETIYHIVK